MKENNKTIVSWTTPIHFRLDIFLRFLWPCSFGALLVVIMDTLDHGQTYTRSAETESINCHGQFAP